MLEGEYLELCNQLKDQYEKNQLEKNKLQVKCDEYIKELITCYGIIRIIDIFAEETFIDIQVKNLIEMLRTHLSNFFEHYYIEDQSDTSDEEDTEV